MKIFYKTVNGKIRVKTNHDDNAPTPEGWTETEDKNFFVHDGAKSEYFNGDKRIPDDELVKQGKRIDKRGTWYNKETGEQKNITELDVEADESSFTKEIPIEGEFYRIFEGGKWVVDAKEKEKAEKQSELARLKAEVAGAEQKQIRPLKKIVKNTATKDDNDKYDEQEAIIQTLRPKITKLENELGAKYCPEWQEAR